MKNTTFLSGIFLLTLLLISCPVDKNKADKNESVLIFDRETFDAQRQLWQGQGLQNYSFYLKSDFYAGQPYYWEGTVAVKDGTLFGFITDDIAEYSDFFEEPPHQFSGQWINSIPGILDSIINDSQRPCKDEGAREHTLIAEYDSEFHFPKSYTYRNNGFNPELIGDGSHKAFTITKFAPNPEIEPNTLIFDRETFETERDSWLGQPLSGSHSFRLRYDVFEEDIFGQGPVWRTVWEGNVFYSSGSYGTTSFRPNYPYEKNIWAKPVSDIFDRILQDSEKNYGLAWGCASQSTLEVEYDSQYHFPARYRYHAEPSGVEPLTTGSEGQGKPQRLYEVTITHFVR